MNKPSTETPTEERDRPSRHGALLGEALALLAERGRLEAPPELPEPCLTCAFRQGCMTNQMASTGLVALNCTLGIDPDNFACHHGLKDGEPTRLCAGFIAAKLAPFSFAQDVLVDLNRRLNAQEGPDQVRAAFDAWLAEVDPERKMNDYQLARVHAGNPPQQ